MSGRHEIAEEGPDPLLSELRELILATRDQVARTVNAGLTLLYWQVGDRIRQETLQGKRADYGGEIIPMLAKALEQEFGRGFAEKNLRRMVQFAEVYPDREIVVSLIRELSWTHFIALIPIKDPLKRDFYAGMCRTERWSVRTLRERIGSMLYERTALSRKPESLIASEIERFNRTGTMSPDLLFRDPYLLDFLGLKDTFSEHDLEAALVREMEGFLLELGAGFAFVARQKRITLDGEDFYLDLLFFNRRLRRLVAVELKLGDFKPAYKGQMELYLRWLDRYERQLDEAPPLGLILCAGKKQEQIELLELSASGIHVAEYLTELPPRAVLAERLHQAIEAARSQVEQREGDTRDEK